MFDVRIRLATDSGQPSRVIPTITASVTGYSSPQLRFTVSEKVAGTLDAPFLVLVEYSIGGAYVRPRNDLFIVDEDSADSVDVSGATTFTARNMFSWLTTRMPLWWRPGDPELQRSFTDATPGFVLADVILKSQNITGSEGWAPYVTLGFSATTDSENVAWADRVTQSWPLFTTTISRVLDTLITQGYVEVWTEGFVVKAVAAGTGMDRSDSVVLGGPGVTSAPSKRVFDPATGLVVQHDQGWSYLNNPGADSRFGTLVKVMSQSGAPNLAAASKNAQPALAESRAIQEELSYEWTVAPGMPHPWADFRVGDLVTARTRRGVKLLRVIGFDVSKDAKGEITARAVVGSKILDLQAKVAKRTSATSTGTLIGGNGSTPPPVVGAPSAAPLPPQGLHAESNVGSWRADGTAVADVELEWLAVTQAVEGSSVDVEVYEVWARRASESPSLAFRTSALSVSTDAWVPGTAMYVSVRARSRAGVWSEFSPEIAVTPQTPGVIIPKVPTGLAVSTNTGAFQADGSVLSTVTMSWTAVTHSLDNLPVTIQDYEVKVGLDTQRVTGATATFTIPGGRQVGVTVRALTTLGLWGDPSPAVTVTGALPAALLAAPTKPVLTTAQGIVFAAWDGALTTGQTGPGFGHVVAELALAAAGPWTRVGSPIPRGGGGVNIKGVTGQSVWVRFTGVDTLGRPGAVSASETIVVKAVGVGDIDQAITDAIDKAQSDATSAGTTATAAAQGAAAAQSTADTAKSTADAAQTAATDAQAQADAALRSSPNLIRTTPVSVSGWTAVNGGLERVNGSGGALFFTEIDVTPGQVIRGTVNWQSDDPANTFLTGITRYLNGEWTVDGNGVWIGPVYGTTQGDRTIDYTVPANVTKLRLSAYSNRVAAGTRVRINSLSLQNVTEVLAAQATANAAATAAAQAKAAAEAAATAAANAQTAAGNAQTTANQAQTSASGKSKTYASTLPPSGAGTAEGDTWEQWSTLALGGKLLAFWRYTGAIWVKGALDETYLPLVNIGSGTYGLMKGDRLEAETVTADKILVTDFTDYWYDKEFKLPYQGWVKATHTSPFFNRGIRKSGTGTQSGAYFDSSAIRVTPGDRYRTQITLVSWAGTNSTSQVSLYAHKWVEGSGWSILGRLAFGTAPLASTEFTYAAEFVVPADATRVKFGLFTEANVPTTTAILVTDVQVRRMTAGELIVDGTLKARHIDAVEFFANSAVIEQATVNILKAGVIQVDMLAPNVGQNLDIMANGAVNIIVGRQDEQASALAGLEDGVEVAQGTATGAATAAGTAQSAADKAKAAADAAAASASDVGERLDRHQTYYRFGSTGLAIGDPSVAAELRLEPDAIRMTQNNVVVAEWVGGVFIAPEARLQSALIGNHQWLPYGAGRTIVRPI